jgi:hypothetical protein
MTATQNRYRIEMQSNIPTFLVTRLADGAELFLQGDDAIRFDCELDAAWQQDDVCDEYAEQFAPKGWAYL